jgi:Tol biopolymer transport system component
MPDGTLLAMRRAVPVVALLLAACPPSTTTTTDTTPPDNKTTTAPPDRGPPPSTPTPPLEELAADGETHIKNVRQLTFGGENAEAYWSFGGSELIFQRTGGDFKCDQIFRLPVDGAGAPPATTLVSTGKGRTTCAYFLKGDREIVYASTHERGPECPPPPDHSLGYVWALYDYDIYKAGADGKGVTKLTDTRAYDAEATVCAKDGTIIFTSDRDGDLELYRMDAKGGNVVRLTHTAGYDGGAFFSADCKKIVWRASRPQGKSLEDYKQLLAKRLVRPSRLEIYVANADGSDARQVTYLGAASFAPYLFPSGNRIIFSTNHPDPRGREFDLWAIDTDGTDLERVTYSGGFDGFPMFSPDGKRLVFASNRRDTVPGADGKPTYRMTGGAVGDNDTNIFVADWVEHPPKVDQQTAADRFQQAVTWLADDAREGRGLGTKGLADALDWTQEQLAAAGVEPGMPKQSWRHSFDVTTALQSGSKTKLTIAGEAVAATDFTPLAFSSQKPVTAAAVRAGYGISDPKVLKRDDYDGVAVRGKIAIVHRFTPALPELDKDGGHQKHGDIERKAFIARQKGAVGLIVIDDGDPKAEEAKLMTLAPRTSADAGIPIVMATRKIGAKIAAAGADAKIEIAVELTPVRTKTDNVVGVIRAGAKARDAKNVIVVGAHIDHLGPATHPGSLEGKPGIHNGADDNASGTAALIEVARRLAAAKATLVRDVYVVAFSAEETGLVGSSRYVKQPPTKAKVAAMLNMDMVGRMRLNQLSVLGAESAAEWAAVVTPACEAARVDCNLSGSGYGPSDQMSFYIAGSPVLHFFTGGHLDYHKSTDDAPAINAAGGAQVAAIVADVAKTLASPKPPKLTYKKVKAQRPQGGDMRRAGASLGTIPQYDEDPSAPPGVGISDVVPGGAAQKAGLKGGDRIIKLGTTEIRNIQDMMFVLGNARPGDSVKVTVLRGGKQVVVDAVYGAPRSR